MSKKLEERITNIEKILIRFGKIFEHLDNIIDLLSKESDVMSELIELKSFKETEKINNEQTYFT